MKTIKFLLYLMIIGVIFVGCSSQAESEIYETVAFDGTEMSILKEWTLLTKSEYEISYRLNVGEGEFGFFYIYSYPYPRDVYKSKFIDWEDKTYKDIFELSEDTKLKENMTLLTYTTNFELPETVSFPDHIIQVVVIEAADRVLEVSLDMPRAYYEQNGHILKHIQKSLTLLD